MQDKTNAKVLDMSDAVDGVPQEVSMCIQEKQLSKVDNLMLVIGITVKVRELRRGPAEQGPFLLSLSPPQPKYPSKPRGAGCTEIVAKERKIELMLGKWKRGENNEGEGEGIQTFHSLIPLFFYLSS